MHELGLMESAIEAALESAEESGATRILQVNLRVGKMSGVDPDAMRFAFEVVSADTIAAGATLNIEEIPALCECATCGLNYAPESHDYSCPADREHRTRIVSGTELEIRSMEVC